MSQTLQNKAPQHHSAETADSNFKCLKPTEQTSIFLLLLFLIVLLFFHIVSIILFILRDKPISETTCPQLISERDIIITTIICKLTWIPSFIRYDRPTSSSSPSEPSSSSSSSSSSSTSPGGPATSSSSGTKSHRPVHTSHLVLNVSSHLRGVIINGLTDMITADRLQTEEARQTENNFLFVERRLMKPVGLTRSVHFVCYRRF